MLLSGKLLDSLYYWFHSDFNTFKRDRNSSNNFKKMYIVMGRNNMFRFHLILTSCLCIQTLSLWNGQIWSIVTSILMNILTVSTEMLLHIIMIIKRRIKVYSSMFKKRLFFSKTTYLVQKVFTSTIAIHTCYFPILYSVTHDSLIYTCSICKFSTEWH